MEIPIEEFDPTKWHRAFAWVPTRVSATKVRRFQFYLRRRVKTQKGWAWEYFDILESQGFLEPARNYVWRGPEYVV